MSHDTHTQCRVITEYLTSSRTTEHRIINQNLQKCYVDVHPAVLTKVGVLKIPPPSEIEPQIGPDRS